MTTARELMTEGAECARTDETVSQAAQKMRDLGVGALPICGEDDRLAGMITDRDIVLRCVAEGHDVTQMTVADYADGKPVTIGADDDVADDEEPGEASRRRSSCAWACSACAVTAARAAVIAVSADWMATVVFATSFPFPAAMSALA